MSWLNWVLIGYATLTFAGGLQGYIGSKSVASIAAASTITVLILGATWLSKSNPKVGYGVAAVVAALTLGQFIPRYQKSGAVWPALIMIIASGLTVAALIAGHVMNLSAERKMAQTNLNTPD